MSVEVEFLGHSTFEIHSGEHRILIDPFFTGNPQAKKSADELNPTAIVLSHGHGDHVGDTIAIAKRTGALVIANYEIVTWLSEQGVENVHGQHQGGGFQHPFGRLKLTIAFHGSMLPDGSNGGNPCGLLFELPEATIYFSGDTALFSDMQLIGEAGIDLAILPIGDNFTMGPDDALRAVQFLKPKQVVPCHYNTWPPIEQDAHSWAKKVDAETEAKTHVMQSGDVITV
ncbi:MAG: metal-dependent hydrolase [Planctomycetaceae bacterium]|nr:metal-dependent hydrolase [Planctomycetaceae bacterium]